MTNTEQAKLTTLEGVSTFMNKNATAYTGVQLIIDSKTNFDAAVKDTKTKASDTMADNSGFSQDKADKKKAAIEEAAAICGYAKEDWDDSQPALAGQLHDNESDYHLSDSECGTLLNEVYGVLDGNSGLLNADHVSATDLTTMKQLIDDFTNAQGSSDAAHEAQPEATDAFKKSLAVSMKKLKKLLKACKKVRKTQAKFYDSLVLVAEIVPIAVRHTHIHLTVKNKLDGKPLEGALASFSNSKKTGESDAMGMIVIDEIWGGNVMVTLKKTGFKDLVVMVHINGGKDNVLTLAMEAVVVI